MSHAICCFDSACPAAAGPVGRRSGLDAGSGRGTLRRDVADRCQVVPAVPPRGTGRDGRPVLGNAPPAEADPVPVVRKIVHLRWKQRLGPVEIGDRLGMPASTVHAVLVRCRLNRLAHLDRATGEPIRRYEHQRPGDLIHVDVKKLGRVPDGGGWRYVGVGRASGTGQRRWPGPGHPGADIAIH